MLKLYRVTTVPISFETLLKGQSRFMQQFYDVTIICSDKERLENIGENEGVKTFTIELTRQITPLNDIKALLKFYFYLKKENPNIIHTHTPKAGLIGMIAAFLAKIPHRLHTVAGMPLMESNGLKRKLLKYTEIITYKCANRVYPNSKGLYNFILNNNFCSEHKLKIIGNGSSNGIDTSHFSPNKYSFKQKEKLKKKLNIPFNDTIFCFIGRLVKDKGINELVQVFIEINIVYPNTKLLLVGFFECKLNPLLPEIEKIIQYNPNIIFVGFQDDVRPFLAISDIFVFPSNREGFPNVVLQAGAMEIPCIVTNINGCNEIIEDGVNGIIIPPKNKEKLKEKMQLLLRDAVLRDKLKQNSRKMITSRYEQKMFWEELLDEYKSLEHESV